MAMKKHDIEFLLGYGIKNFKEKLQSTSDGSPNNGKWFKQMDEGFVCGDTFTVIRFYSLDNFKILEGSK